MDGECAPRERWPALDRRRDDATSVDDLFATGKIHIERMDSKTYWIGIYLDDGSVVHIDVTSPRRIHAFMRGVDEPRKAKP